MLSKDIIEKMALPEVEAQLKLLQQRKKALLKSEENQPDYACTKEGNRKVIIIGGQGKIGKLFADLFAQSAYQVSILESDNWQKAEEFFEKAALVLVAVPINVTTKVIQQLTNLPDDCVLADVTSIKREPLNAMLNTHAGNVVGLHPMFGPDVKNFHEQTIVVCHGRGKENYQWLLQQLEVWKAELFYTTSEEHDEAMIIVQSLRHFSTIAYGYHLFYEGVDLDTLLAICSPIYRLELTMVGRLFAQDPSLYTEIIFSNPESQLVIKRFIQRFERLLSLLKDNDKVAFNQVFLRTKDWFGEYADNFLNESGRMLTNCYNKDSQQESKN